MKSLHLYSEPYAPTGSISAEGAKNTLGRPRVGLAELLLRETLQNSCDAQDPDAVGTVRFGIEHVTPNDAERAALRMALENLPGNGLPLGESLTRDFSLLLISDRGTTGLGGPTRADTATDDGVARDFVALLRNIGDPPDKQFGSGTYGYGKSVLFRASAASTIVVHTRCRERGASVESRLLVAALGTAYEHGGVNMTGRHWWGVADDDVGAEPLLNGDADAMAASIGLPLFEGDELGTTIAVVDPVPDLADDPAATANRFARAALLYAWPRLAGVPGIDPLGLRFAVDGVPLPLTDPATDSQLRGFVSALRRLNDGDSERLQCLRPLKTVGHWTFETVSPDPVRPGASTDPDSEVKDPFTTGVHHTALMRHAHLVISYRPGPRHHIPGVGWAAVFVADDEVDRAFAQSEPPTHDDWNPDLLPSRSHEKRFVNTAKRRIDEAADAAVASKAPEGGAGHGPSPLGRVADALADLVSLSDGPRPGGEGGGRGGGGGGGTGGPTVSIDGGVPRIDDLEGPVIDVQFRANPTRGSSDPVTVEATTAWALDDSSSDAEGPDVLGWIGPDGNRFPPGPITAGPGTWTLRIAAGDPFAVVVDIRPVRT